MFLPSGWRDHEAGVPRAIVAPNSAWSQSGVTTPERRIRFSGTNGPTLRFPRWRFVPGGRPAFRSFLDRAPPAPYTTRNTDHVSGATGRAFPVPESGHGQ